MKAALRNIRHTLLLPLLVLVIPFSGCLCGLFESSDCITTIDCANGQVCIPDKNIKVNGKYILKCTDPADCKSDCPAGTKRCVEEKEQTCQTHAPNCHIWAESIDCAKSEVCDKGCRLKADTCKPGISKCESGKVSFCTVRNQFGEHVWSDGFACAHSSKCNGDRCAKCDVGRISCSKIDAFSNLRSCQSRK